MYEGRQRQALTPSAGGFLGGSAQPTHQEHTMADPAFAATTVAVFALLSLVARGMDRL
ncbi:hypothetical protein [Streptomyces sp. AA1529]|uniref:hypothetical protein n=1 Tax=Streptomyces sp. AA1529 TaxID=1203257 RepID=UPI000315B53B